MIACSSKTIKALDKSSAGAIPSRVLIQPRSTPVVEPTPYQSGHPTRFCARTDGVVPALELTPERQKTRIQPHRGWRWSALHLPQSRESSDLRPDRSTAAVPFAIPAIPPSRRASCAPDAPRLQGHTSCPRNGSPLPTESCVQALSVDAPHGKR